jgi:UDP-N-acetyl-D-glucosamine dehydrogenase
MEVGVEGGDGPRSDSAGARLAVAIQERAVRVAVIGQGYVGLPLAVELGRAGFSVVGIDTDPDRIAAITIGQSYSPDVPREHLEELLRDRRYTATTDFQVIEDCQVVVICVPTPLRKSKDPDISFVAAAAEQVAARFRPGQLVILESTTYPGTTEELLLPLFEARGARVGVDLFLAFSPERIDPANTIFKMKDIPKIVGGVTETCTRLAALLYGQVVVRVLTVSSPRVAELAKLYENVFRNVNIALANEFAIMCRRLGVNSREVIDAAATKPFGFLPFYPGPGIGGHCIAVDPFYLAWKMRLNGYEARFVHLADEINASMPSYVVQLVVDALNDRRRCLNGARVLALGVAYKRGVGDIRESPALEILERLRQRGALVSYVDPYVPSIALGDHELKAIPDSDENLTGSDCVLILTDHPDFDYARAARLAPLIVDARNATWGITAADDHVVRL